MAAHALLGTQNALTDIGALSPEMALGCAKGQLAACILYLRQVLGSREAYNIVQRAADDIAHTLVRPTPTN